MLLDSIYLEAPQWKAREQRSKGKPVYRKGSFFHLGSGLKHLMIFFPPVVLIAFMDMISIALSDLFQVDCKDVGITVYLCNTRDLNSVRCLRSIAV